MFTKPLYKNEVAELYDCSSNSLRILLNVEHFEELAKLGYKKTQKKLNPNQLNYLHDKIGLSNEN